MNAPASSYRDRFSALFDAQHPRLFRVLCRLCGDPELAADVAQDAFVRLWRRGSLPDRPEAWLITVALNRFRNTQAKRSRRLRLLTPERAAAAHSDSAASPAEELAAAAARERVRRALDGLSERERALLLMHAEGYAYRDIAAALSLHEPSIGTLLARARRAFRTACEESSDAPRR